ncbi:CAP family protein [Streptomyces sp. NPDC003016]
MDDAFQQDCLKTHNAYRARHGAPALKIDPKIVDHAKSRVNYISQYEGLSKGYSGFTGYGESRHWSATTQSGQMGTCQQAVTAWYDERRKYDYARPGYSMETGFFTQVVWKETTSIGCARAAGQSSKWYETYVVCNYQPPGNYQGRYEQNVLPPTG